MNETVDKPELWARGWEELLAPLGWKLLGFSGDHHHGGSAHVGVIEGRRIVWTGDVSATQIEAIVRALPKGEVGQGRA
jgi:hypothetical protein